MKRKILVPFVLLNIIALTSCTLIRTDDNSKTSSEEDSLERSENESSDIVIEESESIEESSEESFESESTSEIESESEEESESKIIKDNMSFGEGNCQLIFIVLCPTEPGTDSVIQLSACRSG